jgi:hypothetical protein
MVELFKINTDWAVVTMGSERAKALLDGWIKQNYREFTLNSEQQRELPSVSPIPWIGASKRKDVYRKKVSHALPHHIKFITKNDDPHAFIWQTNAQKVQEGVRWGIIKTYSVTSNVISALGQYRIVAHERVMKGLISNSQTLKLKLLDLYQDRFTALQSIESLVSKNTTEAEYQEAFEDYIVKLQILLGSLNQYFEEIDCPGFDNRSIEQIRADIQEDVTQARIYLASLKKDSQLRSYNRSRGEDSVLEFVKQRMIQGLYEFQGINQDITYSRSRYFALTRGEMNDFIEDARKVIDDYEADPRNAVRANHHGIYSSDPNELVAYDFPQGVLSPQRQRQIVTAISYIEGWDVLEHKKGQKPCVSNGSGKEYLSTYQATRWRTHRNIKTFIKSIGFFILNSLKGIFVATHSRVEETWSNKDFHLNGANLQQYLSPREPLWKKPLHFAKQIGHAFMDILYGIRDFGAKLVIHMPEELVNDWNSSKQVSSLDDTLTQTTQIIQSIAVQEKERLELIMKQCGLPKNETANFSKVKLADVEYELSGGEFNDILNSMVRGTSSFSSVFTHNIYSKDPVGGLMFTAFYLVGAGVIFLPALSTSVFGSGFVNAVSSMSYAMASSPLGATIAGGSTLAELAAVAWDGLLHGPTGMAAGALYEFLEDPLTISAYAFAAYALGYILANGIAGQPIPWLSEVLKEDLGTNPSTGYPIIGGKVAVILYEILITHARAEHVQPELINLIHELHEKMSDEQKQIVNRFKLVTWLSTHAKMLPKLEAKDKFAVRQQIDRHFSKEESQSLNKLFYPEPTPSIAFQIFSIPLSYIPAVLRFIVSFGLSFAAWIKGNPNPINPIREASFFLVNKIKTDLSRLIKVVTNLTFFMYSLSAAFIKMGVYLAVMLIGRIGGLLDLKPAHAMHRACSSVHQLMRIMGEFFYPARAMKDVSVAHSTDTIIKNEFSYIKLLQKMKGTTSQEKEAHVSLKKEHSPATSFFSESKPSNNTSCGLSSGVPI